MIIPVFWGVLGAALGSFACCQAWRIRKKDKTPRSHCMHCDYKLKWYDNIPVLSWLMLGGKCRKCHKAIGAAEILSELGLAAVFVLSFLFWPYAGLKTGDPFEIAKFVIFCVQLVCFAILFVFDAKWGEMPTKVLIVSCVLGALFFGVGLWQRIYLLDFKWEILGELCGAMLILPGFYYLIYKASKEAWVGSGDPILCVPIAMMLSQFWLALFCLFASNMIGSVIMLPVVIAKRSKSKLIPFGPFLIMGFLLIFFLQHMVMSFVSI